MNKIEIILQNLTEQLTFIDLEIDDILLKCKKSVEVSVESIQKLKKVIENSGKTLYQPVQKLNVL